MFCYHDGDADNKVQSGTGWEKPEQVLVHTGIYVQEEENQSMLSICFDIS
jgi:hypothetical protein